MWRWLGRLLVHSVFLILANMIAIRIIVLAYAVLIKGGAQLPANLLDVHILWRSLLVGFLAGILPVALLLASFGWINPLQRNSEQRSVQSQPQFWTWIPYSCWMLFGIVSWLFTNWNHSVISTSQVPPIAAALQVFLTDPCEHSATVTWADLLACRYQVEFAAPWVLSIGYSLAAIPVFLRSRSTALTQNNENSF
jgi:hypothetical protein